MAIPNAPTTAGAYVLDTNTNAWVAVTPYEVTPDGTLGASLTLDLTRVNANAPTPPQGLALVSKTATTISVKWTRSPDSTVSGYRVKVNGVTSGGDQPTTATTATLAGLTAATAYTITVVAYNSNGESAASNSLAVTTSAAASGSVPTAVTTFTQSALSTTSATYGWTETTDATVTAHRVYLDGVKYGTDLTASASSVTVTNLAVGSSHTIYVTRVNASGESAPSTVRSFTTKAATTAALLMGSSMPFQPPGGIKQWDAARIYNFKGPVDDAISGAGVSVIGLTDNNDVPIQGKASSATTLDNLLTDLFNKHPNIEIHWANSNEADRHVTNVTDWIATCKAHKDVIDKHKALGHNVSNWIDLTHFAVETKGSLMASMKPVAQSLDGIAFSMYANGGRHHPIVWDDYGKYMDPCFALAADWGVKQVSTWEIGISPEYVTSRTSVPINGKTVTVSSYKQVRPVYACNAAQAFVDKSTALGLIPRIACWWDQGPLSYNPATQESTRFSVDPAGTSPTTAQCWHNWQDWVGKAQ